MTRLPSRALWAIAASGLIAWLAPGCGSGESSGGDGQLFGGSGGGGNSGGSGNNGGTAGGDFGGSGGSLHLDASTDDGGLNADSACQASSGEATLVKKPIDIIFMIDNSGSMSGEIAAVIRNINQNFASIIGASEIDYRVIMIGRHGRTSSQRVCVEAPLSGIPAGGCASPPPQPVNTERFRHFSVQVESHDSLCIALNGFNNPDLFGLAPNGWGEWLREDSFKMFVEISDDGVNCSFGGVTMNDRDRVADGPTVADQFDQLLRTLSPLHFGDLTGERNYRFYSIVGLAANNPSTTPWPPTEPIQNGRCSPGSAGNGTGYQALSIMTEGLRYPSCDNDNFDSIFLAIADGVIAGSQVACEFDIVPPSNGEQIDLETVLVTYTPGGGGAEQVFNQVPNEAACTPGAFYIDSDRVILCPATCSVVQADDAANIGILFGCKQSGPA
ncbi:MAG: hypothetical protein KIT72_14270 [Polyangiaceae bacterium]|nr:hypothetical protein [Polyangiaceae bacterium]MCW5791579.1 hypothetical protein [Polyangiaceae bacterium]